MSAETPETNPEETVGSTDPNALDLAQTKSPVPSEELDLDHNAADLIADHSLERVPTDSPDGSEGDYVATHADDRESPDSPNLDAPVVLPEPELQT